MKQFMDVFSHWVLIVLETIGAWHFWKWLINCWNGASLIPIVFRFTKRDSDEFDHFTAGIVFTFNGKTYDFLWERE